MTYKYTTEELIDFKKHDNIPWLRSSIILLTEHGSQAYGLATPESDLDIKGIAIPPENYFLSPFNRFEQAEGKSEKCEYAIYDIRKFISLAADCNPNIIEVLWTDDSSIIEESSEGKLLRKYRGQFLSTKARYTFSGYAIAQLKRIKTHKRWLMNPPTKPPTREELGLPTYDEISKAKLDMLLADIKKKIDQWNIGLDELTMSERIRIQENIAITLAEMQLGKDEQFKAAAKILNLSDPIIAILEKERSYQSLKHEYEQYLNWKATRNSKRVAIEEKYGYDTKHASHLVRLMRMCEEILTTGEVLVKRPDREEILGIKMGSMTYEQIITYADEQDKKLAELYKTTKLRKYPDRAFLDKLCVSIVNHSLNNDKPDRYDWASMKAADVEESTKQCS